MSEFRNIAGTVLLWKHGKVDKVVGLYMFGAMPFLFVKLPTGHMSHMLPGGKTNNNAYGWSNVTLNSAYRFEESLSVVSAFDIAQETAKRLGVEQS